MPGVKVFVDTSFIIALVSSRDNYHESAVRLARLLLTNANQLITTRAVVLEIGNALSKKQYREPCIRLLESMQSDPNVEIIEISEELFDEAFDMFKHRLDKEWGLVDCLSFVVMGRFNLTDALTTDEHFRQAGFRSLILD